jgi:hypothetical protein
MSAPSVAFVRERKENVKETSGEHDVPARMRDSYVYMSQEGKVVRVGRKAWSALYKSVSPII